MPRIPVYNQQISYSVPTVRTVETARPVAKIPDSRARTLQSLSEAVTFVKKFPQLRDNALDTWVGLRSELSDPWGTIQTWWRNGKPPRGGKENTKPKEGAPKPPQTPPPPVPATPPAAPQAPEKQEPNMRFLSSTSRRGLLNALSSSGGKDISSVAGLDAYAAKAWNGLGQDGAVRETFAQDYAVLRHALLSEEDNRTAVQLKQNWEENARLSGQMASVIRTPQAFGTYVKEHAERLAREAGALGMDGETAARQFKENAVSRNVEAALAAGEASAARAVYQAHADTLTPKRRETLEEKISCAEAESAGQALWMRAQKELEEPSGAAVRRFVLEEMRGSDKKFQSRAADYAGLLAKKEAREKARLQSGSFRALRESDDLEQARRNLLNGYVQDASDLERKRKGVESLFNEPDRPSDRAAFNVLHGQAQSGVLSAKTLDKFFDEGKVNGRDYLLLNERLSARQSGQTDEGEEMLRLSVERFCRKKELSAPEAELVKYRVYSASGTAKERLAVFGQVKDWLAD